jgi:hypothetical protein
MRIKLYPQEVCNIIEEYLERKNIGVEGQVEFRVEDKEPVFYFDTWFSFLKNMEGTPIG